MYQANIFSIILLARSTNEAAAVNDLEDVPSSLNLYHTANTALLVICTVALCIVSIIA